MSDSPLRLKTALAGRYEIERELGQGGMATVFLARDVRHHRLVAVKLLSPELGWPVSDGLGAEPLWSADGRTIYYRGVGQMIAARVQTSPTFAVKSRDVLFADAYRRGSNH